MLNYKNIVPSNELAIGRRVIEEFKNIELLEDLTWNQDELKWVMKCAITIETTSSFVPKKTIWYIFIENSYPLGTIKFYPAKDGGITSTFPHQNYNAEGKNEVPWRLGDLCLDTNSRLFNRLGLSPEPAEYCLRLGWHFERIIHWLKAASAEELFKLGDPFEVPQFPQNSTLKLAFSEDATTINNWKSIKAKYGYAEFNIVNKHEGNPLVVTSKFFNSQENLVLENKWGSFIENNTGSLILGGWLILDEIPVIEPWQAPIYWGELMLQCTKQQVDLLQILKELSPKIREEKIQILMVGFPIPKEVGKDKTQIHWEAIELPLLTKNNKQASKGFRDEEKGYWLRDQHRNYKATNRIKWAKTENWNQEQLISRGSIGTEVSSKPTLIIGAGAVGSVVAELMVRSGQKEMTLLDQDIFQAGNLVRHTLTLNDLKSYKVEAMEKRLQSISPHNRIKSFTSHFPYIDEETQEIIKMNEVIIECTGENDTLIHLENFKWNSVKTFISLSIGYEAKYLYLFIANGEIFSSKAFFDLISPWMEKEREMTDGIEFPREGVGCWHPVFPARADDIWLLVSTAIKNIELAIKEPKKHPTLLVFEQQIEDGIFKGILLISQEEYK
ncbi:ThiF family adenylyltransferase [Planomicrobium sp. CPCC 101079]|uniref:ThiF family adenylyltransferase n=1 Tax=Planomicrobium sp. CPCC 101079 TaxID=2599618 RepID=UPI0011B75CAC|nr:ThiF family adenylyltransferase [Planomicrobium sp. CPCC 101079]TWT01858.1 hypothetical protein FQV28_14595 [Planomicrobium sp. CPCC 101079]